MNLEDEGTPASLRFGDFSLDRRRWRLRRGGEEVSAQPRVLEVLAFLAERSGTLVTKEELFLAVWGETEVGDAALARCISEARKALGDSARDPRYLKTVHGQGFRFLEPVELLEEPIAAPTPQSQIAKSEPVAKPRGRAWALLGMVTAAVLWWSFSPQGEPLVLPAAQPAVRIAMAPVAEGENGLHGPQQGPMIEMLLADLILDDPSLVLRSGGTGDPTEPGGALQEDSEPETPDLVLYGRWKSGQEGETASLELETLDLRGGSESGRSRTVFLTLPSPVRDGDLPSLTGGLEEGLREVLNDLDLGLARRAPLEPPRRLETLRLRRLAQRWMAQGTCQLEPVLEVLEAAKSLDPDYAPVRLEVARAHLHLTTACGLHPRHGDEALRSVERALATTPGWPRARKLEGRILTFQGRLEEALKVLGRVVTERPADPEARYLASVALTQAGCLDGAEEQLRQTLTTDPGYLRAAGEAPLPLLESGQEERFLELLSAPSDPRLVFLRGLALERLGRTSEAIEVLAPALALQPDHLFGRIALALAATLEGDPREASEVLRQLAREQSSPMVGGAWINFRLAQVAARADLPELALEQLGLAVEKGFTCGECLRRDPGLRILDSRQEFRALLGSADARHARIECWAGGSSELRLADDR
ncbi:MAG: winged helix-turn-helix domain-containing protein, partial [Acidobacteria bacterium]|nr:winged helix-turn-helix domain-containing protein [Acidobacteriota bacterium]